MKSNEVKILDRIRDVGWGQKYQMNPNEVRVLDEVRSVRQGWRCR
jgi:hypothetical protein